MAAGGVACEHVVVRKSFLSLVWSIDRQDHFSFLVGPVWQSDLVCLASIIDMVDINDGGEMRSK